MSNLTLDETKLLNKKLGNKKRVELLRSQGKYHYPEFIKNTCKLCGKQYEYDIKSTLRIPNYYKKGYCSNKCYQDSGEKILDKMRTSLINANILFDTNDINDIKQKYSIYQSNQTKRCVNKWKQSNIEKYGSNFAKKRSKRGWKTARKNFLLQNNLVTETEYNQLTEDQIQQIYIKNFNSITNRGESIKNGRLAKYDNNIELYKKSYKDALYKTVKNYLNEQYGEDYINNLNDNEYQELFNEGYTYCMSIRKKGKKSKKYLINWKKSHLINSGISEDIINELSDDEVNKKYSEYISLRLNKLSDTIHNGYKHTKKGWYKFKKYKQFFYRSSWELKVCELLDNKFSNIIKDILSPEPIQYILNDQIHTYFCDFKIIFNNNKELYIEVKPFSKLHTEINEAKFISAKDKWKNNFIIVTENEIFSDQLEKNILNFYNEI